MFRKSQLNLSYLLFFSLLLTASFNLEGQPSHDPSHMVKDGGRYWIYTTGDGIWNMSSDTVNFSNWQAEPTVFPIGTWPSWINTYVPGFNGNFWAPEIIYMNGKWHIYYSCSTFGSQQSAIGVATADSLNGANWTDQGMVVFSDNSGNVNAIDPDIFRDASGKVWLLYGSYWDGIVITQLDTTTGKPIDPNNLYSAANNSCEAGNMLVHDGYYYLFFDRGACCRGIQSTYHILMGRSTSPTGPFYDKDSVNTYNSDGGSVFLHSDGRFIGPGHFGYGEEKLTYHYYDGNKNGDPTLRVATINWENGWPVAVYSRSGGVDDGEYVIENRNSGKVLDLTNGDTLDGTNVEQNTVNLNESQKWMIKYVGDGYYNIFPSSAPDKALEVSNCSSSNGANVQIGKYTNADCQQWYFAYMGVSIYRIMAKHSLMALEIASALTDDGANAQQWPYNENPTQNWYFKNPADVHVSDVAPISSSNQQIRIYPNPSKGSFTIDPANFSGAAQIKIEIYSMDGRLLFQTIAETSNNITINRNFETGVYLVKIIAGERTLTKKILVE